MKDNEVNIGAHEAPLFTATQIESAVVTLAQQINVRYCDNDKPIVLLGVMNGGLRVLNDLLKYVHVPCKVETIKLHSYDGTVKGVSNITDTPKTDLSSCVVIIVEDIVDSGETINGLKAFLGKRYNYVKVEVCTLLKRANNNVECDYVGFEVPEGLWVMGYGMDDSNGLNRNLNEIRIEKVI